MQKGSSKRRVWIGLGLVMAVLALVALLPPRASEEERAAAPADARAPEEAPLPPGPIDIASPVLAGRSPADDAANDWSLVVTVLGDDDEPRRAEAVRIRLWAEGLPEWDETTDDAGQVRLGPFLPPLPPAGFEVHVETQTHDSQPWYVRAAPSPDEPSALHATVRFVAASSVSGWVRLPPGVPPEHAYVWIHRRYARDHDYHKIRGDRLSLDEEGRFFTKFDTDEDTDDEFGVEVTIAHEGRRWYGCANGTVPARDVEVALGPLRPGDPAILRVHVRTPAGPPKESMLVTHFDDGLQVSRGYSAQGLDEDREVCFLWRPHAKVYVRADVYEPEGFGTVAVGPLSVEATDVDLPVPPTRILHGHVRGPDGQGVPDAKVWARLVFLTARGRDMGFLTEDGRTDETGAFRMSGLGPYTYFVNAQAGGSAGPIRGVDVGADEDGIELVVQPAARAQLRVVDPEGKPVEGAIVELSLPPRGVRLDPAAPPLVLSYPLEFDNVDRKDTTPGGHAAFLGLDAGIGHRLVVLPPRTRPELAGVERQGWRPTDATIRLEAGLTIRGRALKDDGRPVRDAYVYARALDETKSVGTRYRRIDGSVFVHAPTAYVRRDEDGRFVVGPLPPGRYALHADGGEEVIATAGDEEVELRGASPWEQVWLVIHLQDLRPGDRSALALLGSEGKRIRALPLGPGGRVIYPHVGVGENPDLWIGGLADGRYVWLRDLRLSEEMSGLTFRAQRGETITGRIELPAGVMLDTWRVLPVAPLLRTDADGVQLGGFPCTYGKDKRSFDLTGVPPGSWSVRIEGSSKGKGFVGTTEARAGDRVVVNLAPR